MIQLKKAMPNDLEKVLEARYRTLRAVFGLKEDYVFDGNFRAATRNYYEKEDQTTVVAFDGEAVVGCATICYMTVVPTPDHPAGKRGHIMNVHTEEAYRRQGIGSRMMNFLIDEAKERGVTEISLDATDEGRLLYEKCGFQASTEGMVLLLHNK